MFSKVGSITKQWKVLHRLKRTDLEGNTWMLLSGGLFNNSATQLLFFEICEMETILPIL